jgi:hypothetical protein
VKGIIDGNEHPQSDHRSTCRAPRGEDEHHHHITQVKWHDGATLTIVSRNKVVEAIENDDEVIVRKDGTQVAVTIEIVGGVKYIKTTPDHTKKDNLLSLPRF